MKKPVKGKKPKKKRAAPLRALLQRLTPLDAVRATWEGGAADERSAYLYIDAVYLQRNAKELRALIQWLERAADRLEAGSA